MVPKIKFKFLYLYNIILLLLKVVILKVVIFKFLKNKKMLYSNQSHGIRASQSTLLGMNI